MRRYTVVLTRTAEKELYQLPLKVIEKNSNSIKIFGRESTSRWL